MLRMGPCRVRARTECLNTHEPHQTLHTFAINLQPMPIPQIIAQTPRALVRVAQMQRVQLAEEKAEKRCRRAGAWGQPLAVPSHLAKGHVISWGSSYSATLVLKLAGEHPELADATVSFSPGEYFPGSGKTWIQDSSKKIQTPVFITSAKHETEEWSWIFTAIPTRGKTGFIPEGDGKHGSRALWKQYPDSASYWSALTEYLKQFISK